MPTTQLNTFKCLAIITAADRPKTREAAADAESPEPALRRAARTKASMSSALHFSPTQMQ